MKFPLSFFRAQTVVALCALVPFGAAPAHAGSAHPRAGRASCKDICAAVGAGRTLDEITSTFDTDAESVVRCTQGHPKHRKTKAAANGSAAVVKHPAHSHAAAGHPSSSQKSANSARATSGSAPP